ncbi:MAG: helix-turn-helix domain-containing protein [Thermoanaerobaculia bacterium]
MEFSEGESRSEQICPFRLDDYVEKGIIMPMRLEARKRERIEKMGGRVTTVEEWLELSPEEVAIIDMKIQLGEELKALRRSKKLSQEKAAEILNTSQGRVSKMERGQASLDQLAWCLLVMGKSRKALARAISGSAGT